MQSTMEQASQFIRDQDLVCLECHRAGDEEGWPVWPVYLRLDHLGANGVWHLVCEQGAHDYTVWVTQRETDDTLDTITMEWQGSWAQFVIGRASEP